uniref:Uncharacterized protein n=1 Tax=Oryza meridionalis TaxID=40149 RepID=A0A0E0DIV0_9ORYZ
MGKMRATGPEMELLELLGGGVGAPRVHGGDASPSLSRFSAFSLYFPTPPRLDRAKNERHLIGESRRRGSTKLNDRSSHWEWPESGVVGGCWVTSEQME